MDKKPVIIFGANELGVAAKEIFDSNGMIVYCFLDDDEEKKNKEIVDVSVLGKTNDQGYLKLIGKKCDGFIAYDENNVRKALIKMLQEKRKVMPVNAVHQTATISPSAHFGYGNLVNAGVIVGTNAKISNHTILHTNAVVDHHASVGDYAQIGAGAIINSLAIVEDEAFIGSRVTVVSGVTIGKGARVGAGSVVISDVKPGETVFGNPASAID